MRLDHLLSREPLRGPVRHGAVSRVTLTSVAAAERPPTVRPSTSTEPGPAAAAYRRGVSWSMLLSFERPARRPRGPTVSTRPARSPLRRSLKTAQQPQTRSVDEPIGSNGYHRLVDAHPAASESADHRQDSKSTWWMPWHLESKKGVDDCDKPRGSVEQLVIRGCPNGETRRR